MVQAALQVLLYAVLAGLSPLAFAATIAVMQAGRPKALAFGIGFVAAQLLTCSMFVAIGAAASGSTRNKHPGIQLALEISVAITLIWLAARVRRKSARTRSEVGSARARRLLDRLGRLGIPTVLAAGLLLGIGVPKRLALTVLAATAISTSDLGYSGEAALVLVYATVATALVWGPIFLLMLVGERAVARMKRAQGELADRQPEIVVHALLVLAGMFTIDAAGVVLTQIY